MPKSFLCLIYSEGSAQVFVQLFHSAFYESSLSVCQPSHNTPYFFLSSLMSISLRLYLRLSISIFVVLERLISTRYFPFLRSYSLHLASTFLAGVLLSNSMMSFISAAALIILNFFN